MVSCGGPDGSVVGTTSASPVPESFAVTTTVGTLGCGAQVTATSPAAKDGCLSGLELRLEATAGQTPGLLSVSLHMTNTGDRPLMPGIYESELLVDGQPDPSRRLALNGALETALLEIPAGETADLNRELQVAALTPGLHEVAVRIGEQSTPGVRVEVE